MSTRFQPGGMFRSHRLEQQLSSKKIVILLVAAFAFVGWSWFLFGSGFFDIQSYEIQGLYTLDRGEVVNEIEKMLGEQPRRPWKKKNLLMLDKEALQRRLKDRLFVDELAVDKSYPNILRLMIKERQRNVVLVSQEQYVHVDTTGIVTGFVEGELLKISQDIVAARAFVTEKTLPVIVMPTAEPLSAGFQIAQPDEIRRWLDVFHSLINAGLKIRFMKIETPESSLARFVSERGYDIYFDIKQPLEPQIATYLAYMRSKPDEVQIKEHLDVRIAGKVFIK